MSSKGNVSLNISQAVSVLKETYRNLEELFNEMDRVAGEENFISLTPKFLRWRSDTNYNGWLVASFIKVYQYNEGMEMQIDGLQEGAVFAVEVNLEEWESGAVICLMKYDFDLSQWTRLPGVSDHWIFWNPFYFEKHFDQDCINDIWYTKTYEDMQSRYWGLRSGMAVEIPLHTVTSTEDVRTKIFDALRRM
ncbi:hypothetical protein [Lysinibacillus sp. LZ02]|uniref:hypothetical protein n=1 Tax=Lysinibacillus sp. LZ02 TaxID=3420668 RepID=UPI003D36D6DC